MSLLHPHSFNSAYDGYRVVLDGVLDYAHTKKIPKSRKRSWKERFFTRPWRPWISHEKWEEKILIKPQIVYNRDMVIMHPKTWEALKEAMDTRNATNKN
jgi:hypothetical protein